MKIVDTPRPRLSRWLLLGGVVSMSLLPGPPSSGFAAGQERATTLRNPIEQREEMIELLRSIDRRLASLEDRLTPKPQ